MNPPPHFLVKGDSGEVDISLENSQDEIQELSVKQESTGTYSLGISKSHNQGCR